MVKVDLIFHHGGDWIRSPHITYARKEMEIQRGYESDHLSFIDLVNEYTLKLGYVGVQQLLVTLPSGKFYEIEGDIGIRTLLDLISDQFNVINLFAVEDNEHPVYVPLIIHHSESFTVDMGAGTDCSSCDGDTSDSDSSGYDSEELELLVAQKRREISEDLSDYKVLHKSMTWRDIPEARKHLNLYCLSNGYGLTLLKSDKTRLRYQCVVGCPFKILISRDGKQPGVRVKTFKDEHTCDTAYYNPRVDYNTIAYYFKEKLQREPKYKVKEMRADLKSRFDLNANHSKCKRAKRMILEELQGSFTDGYKKLEAYANELKISNPGSDVVINISKDALAEGKRRFLRMYICFHALKMGFKLGLRPFIGLDGTFLKGKAKGQILAAVAQDSMNQFYPLAWAVVDKETKVTWKWFVELLQQSLELHNGEGFTFISDMQKGLVETIKNVLPEAKHRYCVKHIEANWCRRWGDGEFKKLLWWAAWSSYEEDFNDQLEQIGNLDREAAEDLVHYPVTTWSRAYFDTVCKNQAVDNNFTESFNAWILDCRYKPIIRMLEDIRIKVMTMLGDHEAKQLTWDESYSPKSLKLYKEYLKIAHRCRVVFNGDKGFEVTEGNDTHTVDLAAKKCTCRTWDLSGIPCAHTIKALLYRKIDPKSAMHWYHTKEAYLLAYKHKLQPVRGEKFWKIEPSQAMEPPAFVNQAGRPRTKRKRQKDEAILRQGPWTASRKGRVMYCSTCGSPGHNSRGCQQASTAKKSVKGKGRGKGKGKGKPKAKCRRTLVNEDSEPEPPRSPPRSPAAAMLDEEDVQLSAPQSSQASQGGFVFMPTPCISTSQQHASNYAPCISTSQQHANYDPLGAHPGFEFAGIDDVPELESDEEAPIRPKSVSEARTRLHLRQRQVNISSSGRSIKFVGDGTGVSQPRQLSFTPKGLTWNGNAAVTVNQLQNQRLKKLKSRKANGNTQADVI